MNRLRLFDHIGKGNFNLIIDTKTVLEEVDDYILDDIADHIINHIIKSNCYDELPRDLDCIVMINNQALYRFEKSEDAYSCDCIECDFMYHFVLWYRKEYNDMKFNGSDEHTKVWGMIENEKQIEEYNIDENREEDIINIKNAIESLEKIKNPKMQPYIEILRHMMQDTYAEQIVVGNKNTIMREIL
ncbi:hypothetical protein [Clostridium beijerinckii]|uniref:hypothetical protein n=1 Tax=Clostridium beijerinckii TaxID=1520 RepID=UPI0015703CB5|nr:hypothetical protein [Clostridium beijerinckii]NRU52469.1 hypothetical protein [Clostridium beijerinckii]NYC69086.1 hypothetical protein [Clostridium beijerinckii]